MSFTKLIPREQRQQHSDLIQDISNAIYGTPEAAIFAEEHIPEPECVPAPKVKFFKNYLMCSTQHLWAVYASKDQKIVVGYVLIGDEPHHNSIGFGINPKYFGFPLSGI